MESLPVLKQAQLDASFVEAVKNVPGGEKVAHCIQCGTCSGSCPSSYQMEYTPRKMILMSMTGMKKEVLSSKAIWLCASCYSCSVRCPRGIPITEIIYLLKNMAIDQGYIEPKLPGPIFYKAFNKMVKDNGRVNEGVLMAMFTLKTDPFKMIGMAPLGIKLLLRGRMHLTAPTIANKEEFKKILSRLREAKK